MTRIQVVVTALGKLEAGNCELHFKTLCQKSPMKQKDIKESKMNAAMYFLRQFLSQRFFLTQGRKTALLCLINTISRSSHLIVVSFV